MNAKNRALDNFPEGVRQHLIDRMRGRAISIANLNQLRLWVDTNPEVPEGIEFGGPRSYKTMFANV